jgi:hypothetical protein
VSTCGHDGEHHDEAHQDHVVGDHLHRVHDGHGDDHGPVAS